MRALPLVLLACLLFALPAWAADEAADEAETNPHHMSGPDDDEGCGFCHEEDMSLSASLLETCLSCHSLTEHSGSAEHLRASAASMARLAPTPVKADEPPPLPLTDDGAMWCGTCHLYHDPRVNEDVLLAERWLPRITGVAGAVRVAVASHWDDLAAKYDQPPPVARFSTNGSIWLRLPVADGRLCSACHTGLGTKR